MFNKFDFLLYYMLISYLGSTEHVSELFKVPFV